MIAQRRGAALVAILFVMAACTPCLSGGDSNQPPTSTTQLGVPMLINGATVHLSFDRHDSLADRRRLAEDFVRLHGITAGGIGKCHQNQFCVVEEVLELMARAASATVEDEAGPLPPPPLPPQSPPPPATNRSPPSRTLVVYAYHETPESKYNLRFLLKHGVDVADESVTFVLVVNGKHTIEFPPSVRVVSRRNVGYDIMAVGT